MACAAALLVSVPGFPLRAEAADLAVPLAAPAPVAPPKIFFARVGFIESFFDTGLATRLGGGPVPGSGGTIAPAPSVAFEAGLYLAPHISVSVAGGFPPVLSLTGTGVFAPSGVLVKTQTGLATLTGQYHFDMFGRIRPYVGAGVGYAIVFRDLPTPATLMPVLRNNAGYVVQVGVDYALTERIGLFLDLKKSWLKQALNGYSFVPGVPVPLPLYARIRSDPILLTSGVSLNF